jgi:hypothetical protein
MINTNVQEVCCDICTTKKVVEIPDDINKERRVPEGWIIIGIDWFAIGSKEKGENLHIQILNNPLHFCSVSCMTNYFSKLYEDVRVKLQISNGHKPLAIIVDPSVVEPQLTTEIFFKSDFKLDKE